MKKMNFIQIAVLGIIFLSCGQKSSDNKNIADERNQILPKAQTDNIVSENLENKYLITNSSVGYFKIGGPWQNFAINEYKYQSIQGYGNCVDACCDGGYSLGTQMTTDEYGWVENQEITIGAERFGESESETDNKNNPDVFYITSDNCSGWYWKNKIGYMKVYSEAFKTSEGIGVGITLEKLNELLGKVVINIGWLEEDADAIQIEIKSYPNIAFILDVDDAIGGYDKLSNLEGKAASISDFKKNTKIRRIIVAQQQNDNE